MNLATTVVTLVGILTIVGMVARVISNAAKVTVRNLEAVKENTRAIERLSIRVLSLERKLESN